MYVFRNTLIVCLPDHVSLHPHSSPAGTYCSLDPLVNFCALDYLVTTCRRVTTSVTHQSGELRQEWLT